MKKVLTTLEQIKSNPKTHCRGGLGGINLCPFGVNVDFELGNIWCVTYSEAIYRSQAGFNEDIDLEKLPENILIEINNQLNKPRQ